MRHCGSASSDGRLRLRFCACRPIARTADTRRSPRRRTCRSPATRRRGCRCAGGARGTGAGARCSCSRRRRCVRSAPMSVCGGLTDAQAPAEEKGEEGEKEGARRPVSISGGFRAGKEKSKARVKAETGEEGRGAGMTAREAIAREAIAQGAGRVLGAGFVKAEGVDGAAKREREGEREEKARRKKRRGGA
ncbi:hypothetical protein BV25DRAFT_1163577 [Artomyces pyxidatus]|uniref:Uncharacterized protein n=1 Tax=Artomyces pyxidatus TaxID=48021 RepID=A0ACB8SDD3_9AGAM|nr:hypothetical protein BV25DRAFT_1163577 [Artomyces pyxidatus]